MPTLCQGDGDLVKVGYELWPARVGACVWSQPRAPSAIGQHVR